MKVRIVLDKDLIEEEVIIKCNKMTPMIKKLQENLLEAIQTTPLIVFYKAHKEYYLELSTILFFETDGNNTYAHPRQDAYITKKRLYELEELLPKSFIRISKSTIVNTTHILSLSNSFGSSTLVEFEQSHKQVYVSRRYLKSLKQRLEERRNYEI